MNRENLKIALMLVALFAAVAIPITIAIFSITYQMTATVGVEETVTAYLDAGCTTEVTKPIHNWGNVQDGTTLSVWIKNTGTVPVNVAITITAQVSCTITPSLPTISDLAVGNSQKLDLLISTVAEGETAISWDLNLDATQA